jgi:His-Xaa-Ser system radical SAM maturase HxsC
MSDAKKRRLIYGGTSNFIANEVLRLESDNTNEASSVFLISERNIDNISVSNKKIKYYIVSGELRDKESELLKKFPKGRFFFSSSDVSFLENGDIIEIRAAKDKAKLVILFSSYSNDNTLVLTNACNSGCIICPLPVALMDASDFDADRIKKIISLISPSTKYLTISGGEPTILKDKFIEVLSFCRNYLPNTSIFILTNGRMLSYKSLVEAIDSISIRNLSFGVPIHSHLKAVHDEITGVQNSFDQTFKGLTNLLSKSHRIELRVVINKKNYKDLDKISGMISDNFQGVYRVSFMGMELLGRALRNSDSLWVEYGKMKESLQSAAISLLTKGIAVKFFNIPLCKIDKKFRSLCAQSISDYKVEFFEECDLCKNKSDCGGVFASSLNELRKEGVEPILN